MDVFGEVFAVLAFCFLAGAIVADVDKKQVMVYAVTSNSVNGLSQNYINFKDDFAFFCNKN